MQDETMADSFAFDPVDDLGAVAVGEPGSRTFYLIAGDQDGWVRAWLEKEQLRALAEGCVALLQQDSPSDPPRQEPPATAATAPPATPMLADIHVARLELGYDRQHDLVVLIAHAADSDGERALICRATRAQAAAFAEHASAVCAAGRRTCPLCEQPIDPSGHVCPRSNGHRGL
jgi:uncharacterized repeat protein (TIGR03847 family)